jgi:predicted NAD/FAD-dependent oxidoreductase
VVRVRIMCTRSGQARFRGARSRWRARTAEHSHHPAFLSASVVRCSPAYHHHHAPDEDGDIVRLAHGRADCIGHSQPEWIDHDAWDVPVSTLRKHS